MNYPVPGICPVCGRKLAVSKLSCHYCETTIEGNFESCKFCGLSPEQKYFVEIFLKSRGNIKEVERELGISYPTVRSRLDNVLEAMGYQVEQAQVEQEEMSQQRKEILEKLAQGKITADAAIKQIKALD